MPDNEKLPDEQDMDSLEEEARVAEQTPVELPPPEKPASPDAASFKPHRPAEPAFAAFPPAEPPRGGGDDARMPNVAPQGPPESFLTMPASEGGGSADRLLAAADSLLEAASVLKSVPESRQSDSQSKHGETEDTPDWLVDVQDAIHDSTRAASETADRIVSDLREHQNEMEHILYRLEQSRY